MENGSILHYPNLDRIQILVLVLMIMVKFVVSQPPKAADCVLDSKYLSSDNSTCSKGADWGGFLNKKCGGSAFPGYLTALGLRANLTGVIYLNSSEQTSCLDEMENSEEDVFRCGIDKLTSGRGGCSDFFISNVTDHFADDLKSLTESCKLEGPDGEWEQMCSSCVNSWQEIRGVRLVKASNNGALASETDADLKNSEAEICRFSVLITLTSGRIADEVYVRRVHKCIGEKSIISSSPPLDTAGNQEGKKGYTISKGILILVGVLLVLASITIGSVTFTYIASRSCCRSSLSSERNAFKDQRLRDSSCPQFSIKEIYSATSNLNINNLIGEGTAGKVYKGKLSNNQWIAVKHIISDGNVETVVREVASLSHVQHPNLVSLLGYCATEEECFLIYELCPNGNLSKWLFGKGKILSWIRRLEIAIDSARGLWFLHTFPDGCIVHRDIKPTNILLGPNFDAKLSDFGLSKIIGLGETHAISEVRGTFGYVDPEYQSDYKVNSSGDVYSFGIVLLQILSGKKVINMNLKRPMPLSKMAKSLPRDRSKIDFADPILKGEYSAEAFDLTFQLALSCTDDKERRPCMEQVVAKLEEALDISTRAKSCTPDSTPNWPLTW